MKRLLVFLCVIALIIGVFSVSAAAQVQQEENPFRAGYAMVDINPWWSVWTAAGGEIPYAKYTQQNIMPLPMDGYGGSISRLAEPTLADDNGDGYVTAGVDSVHPGDGLQATCIALQKSGRTLLLISVDMLRVDDTWGKAAREQIQHTLGIPKEQIMICASHTHGGVDMDMSFSSILSNTYKVTGSGDGYTGQQIRDYRDAYVSYVIERLVQLADEAIENAVAVTARRGTIQANLQSGKNMASVRHYQQWYNTKDSSYSNGYKSTKYVRGANFNSDIDMDGSTDPYQDYLAGKWRGENYKSSTVSATDDKLHVLELIPDAGESILLVNWRAHAHTASKQGYHTLTGDYVNSMRKSLADAGYMAGFFQGASGNLDNFNSARETLAWYRVGTSAYAQRSVNYGDKLADIILALVENTSTVSGAVVEPMREVATGEIKTRQLRYKFAGNKATYVENEAATDHNAGVGCSRTSGQYPCVHKVKDEAGNEVTYVIASAYHANNVITRYKYKGNWSPNGSNGGAELNVLTIGNEMAFVTAPFELFDRYSMDVTLTTANSDNDWNDLAQLGYGTPFVFSCTNEYWGYMPNHLAYNYQQGYLHEGIFASGCYESQTCYVADGCGEELIRLYGQVLEELKPLAKACPNCDNENAKWEKLDSAILESYSYQLPAGHYYLSGNLTAQKAIAVRSGSICLDLSGKSLTGALSGGFAVMDSATDDYDVSDGIYGTVPAGSDMLAADGYLPVTVNGKTSFHKYEIGLSELVVNTDNVGITYKANFLGDEKVKAQVAEFGVALSVKAQPDRASIETNAGDVLRTAMTPQLWQTGTQNTVKSVYVRDILQTESRGGSTAQNKLRGNMPVYGVAYIKLVDGTYALSDACNYSLKTALQLMSSAGTWNDVLTEADRDALAAFYTAWQDVMQDWTGIDTIRRHAAQ